MMSSSRVSRARPLLGTLVVIGVEGLPEPEAHQAIEGAFDAIADIDRLMSFHRPDSDLGRLNQSAARGAVRVDRRTVEVLACALDLAERTQGLFDITVAPELVARGALPCPWRAPIPAAQGTWRDIEILGAEQVRFRRPLWVDLGGIAKGYAVDCAVERLRRLPDMQCVVNAGGDIRVFGPRAERIGLKDVTSGGAVLPVVELENGSLASSSGRGQAVSRHLHGRTREPVGQDLFVSVAAERCIIADAMTKCVLAMGPLAEPLLAQYGAVAFLQDKGDDWRQLGAVA